MNLHNDPRFHRPASKRPMFANIGAVAFIIVLVVFLMIAYMALFIRSAPAQTVQTAQESVEKTIGSLVVGNATCNATVASLRADLNKANAEIEELKRRPSPLNPAPSVSNPASSGQPQKE